MPEWLRQRARLSPDRLALVFEDERWTFAELDRRVSGAAGRLAVAGVEPGNLVALLARNGSGFAQLVHAVPRLGAVLMPLNVRLTADELAWQLRDSGARFLVSDEPNAAKAAELKKALPSLSCLSLAELTECDDRARSDAGERRVSLSAVHSVIYTSGTSGRPKGAMLTFGNHLWSAMGSALNLGLRNDDRWLACMPLFHVGGLAILLRSVIYGSTAVVQESFDPDAVNRAIDEDGITTVSVVSAMLSRMLEARGERPYPETLRCVLAGGGPLPRPLLEECARRGVPVVQTYGLTEAASQVATLSPEDALLKLGSAGRPLFPTEIRIEDEQDQALPAGEAGEIVVRGPTVTAGYLNDAEATARALRDGWLHTGDIGYLDEEGLLYVLDRRDDLIVSGGENVYPAEVEEVLRSHPAVLDAAVVGLPDERWGRRVAAAVALRPGSKPDEEELLAFCRKHLASYKAPTQLHIVEQLPRNAAGKLLRRAVRDEWPKAELH
ncbi:MAG: o-succinylbenzoate--CoA ligase [Chloroflexi bacterium]|nr:o-succinylbenzoate--CoA ligase [Chloroflexota bacterium]